MNANAFKPKVYVKEGCPFSFKYMLYMAEAGLLDQIELVRMDPADPSYEATKSKLSEGLGKAATFPTVELEPGHFMSDSDQLIERFAQQSGRPADEMPVLSFYKETIFPQLLQQHGEK